MDLNYYNFSINPVGLIGSASSRYIQQVHEHLRWIHRTTSGRLLLNCIRRPNFRVEIRPHPIAECNATGGGETKAGAAGVSGFVTYSPFELSAAGSCGPRATGNDHGRVWDEMLFHELVHVFRNATGMWNQAPNLTMAMKHYTDNEEFIAVLCTNVYISDRTNRIKSGLRASHNGFSAMSAADAARFGLFAESKGVFGFVKQFCTDHPIFSKALSDKLADVEYNPISDFYRFPKICEAFSVIGAIKDRTRALAALRAIGIPLLVAEKIADFHL